MNLENVTGGVSYMMGVELKSTDQYFRALKTHKPTYAEYLIDPEYAICQKYAELTQEDYDMFEPYTFAEALKEENLEIRRVLFKCLGPERIFGQADPKFIDKQTINKKRLFWDKDNNQYYKEFEDTYELYEIAAEKVGISREASRWGGKIELEPVRAVRCWCTTTNREYWIMVPHEINRVPLNDAIEAIAQTIWIDIDNPESISRQGDVIIVHHPKDMKRLDRKRPLTKKEYIDLMVSET